MTQQHDDRSPPIGAGHLEAMGRLGLKELRAAAFFHDSNIAQPSEQGLYGTATPQEVMDSKVPDEPSQLESPVQRFRREAAERGELQQGSPQHGREQDMELVRDDD